MGEDGILGLVAIVLIFGTPLLITFAIITSSFLGNLLRQRDKENARKVYRDLLREKIDILKTAMLIEYRQDELGLLDRRLEQLIGEDKLRGLLLGDANQLKQAAEREQPIDLELELKSIRKIREVSHG
jgi:hypothetical protein